MFSTFAFVASAVSGLTLGAVLVLLSAGGSRGVTTVFTAYAGFAIFAQLLLVPVVIIYGIVVHGLLRIFGRRWWHSPLGAIAAGTLLTAMPLMPVLAIELVGRTNQPASSPLPLVLSCALFTVGGGFAGLVYWRLMTMRYPELRDETKPEHRGDNR